MFSSTKLTTNKQSVQPLFFSLISTQPSCSAFSLSGCPSFPLSVDILCTLWVLIGKLDDFLQYWYILLALLYSIILSSYQTCGANYMRTFFQCCQIVSGSQRNFRKISEDKSARVKTVGRQCFRLCYRPSLNVSNSLRLCSQVLLRTPPQLQ